MNYPLISEYVEAVKSAEDNFKKLKYLRPVLDDDSCPVHSIGNFAVVFKMQNVKSGKFHAVRCFHREQAGRAENYRLIEEALSEVDSPYLVPFRYMENELSVVSSQTQDKIFPVTLMDWVDGMTLGKYLREHIANKHTLEMLVYRFSQLAIWLMQQPFAHGDLKPNNIIVRPDGSLALVDYDATFVPAMQGQQARELGSPDFCHPLRTKDEFNEHIDDFPIISILLSLKLIALHPEYLKEYGAADRLLFSVKDYKDLISCQLLKEVLPSVDAEMNKLISMFMQCHSAKDLANVSFELLDVEKPKGLLSTEITDEDLENVWEDESSVLYSQDKKQLLECDDEELERYTILEGTEVVGDAAFAYCFSLQEIIIPNSVISIGDFAFAHCNALKKIIIPNSVTFIGKGAFEDCPSIEEIDIPNSVVSIGDAVFFGCSSLKEIVIPDTATSIGNDAFSGCFSLFKIVIPDSVTSIGKQAFSDCSSLKEIVIPDSVTSIGDGAFSGCSSLTEITIPELVTLIGDNIFDNCFALKRIIIPYNTSDKFSSLMPEYKDKFVEQELSTGIAYEEWRNAWEDEYGVKYSKNRKRILRCYNDVYNDEKLKIYTILEGTEVITDRTFEYRSALQKIFIPNSVVAIGNRAFCKCSSLKEVDIPDSVTSIGDGTFKGCCALEKITIPDTVTFIGDAAFSGCSALKEICIPGAVTSISHDVFSNCSTLYKINIPSFVTSIGTMAFFNCSTLQKIAIPQSVTSIGWYAFRGCEKLKEIAIPNSVTSMGGSVFQDCKNLRQITLSNSLTSIGNFAFGGCYALQKITIPNSVTSIDSWAFSRCTSLQEIIIPNSVISIGDSAFSGCEALIKVALPISITFIGNNVFQWCNSLKEIIIPQHTRNKFATLLPSHKDKLIEQ